MNYQSLRLSFDLATRHPGRRYATRGVTLVEVAVLTFFVGVLAFTLVPALASIRVSSKETRCLSNLMQIGFANTAYASRELSDPALPVHGLQNSQCGEGWPPNQLCNNPSYIGAYEWGGKSGVGRPGWVEYPGVLGSKYGTAAGFGPPTRPLNEILYKDDFADAWGDGGEFSRVQALADTGLDLPEVHCPADTGYSGIHFPEFRDEKLSSYDHFGTSYTANMFMTSTSGGGEMQSNSPYLHRLSELTSPARTLAYYENNGRFAWSARPMPETCQWIGAGVFGTVMGWHGVPWVFNAVFIDGHADKIFMRSFTTPEVLEDSGLQDSLRCIIVRGENWNKDVLPVPRVSTALNWGGGGRPSWEDGIE